MHVCVCVCVYIYIYIYVKIHEEEYDKVISEDSNIKYGSLVQNSVVEIKYKYYFKVKKEQCKISNN